MLVPALGHPFRDLAHLCPSFPLDVFPLPVPRRPVLGLEQQVDAAVAAVGHLAAQTLVADELRDRLGAHRLLDDPVGPACVDANQMAVHVDQLPGVLQLACRVARRRQPDARPRFGQAEHGSRVGAVGDHHLAALQLDVGQKALVTAQQTAGDKRVGKSHGAQGSWTARRFQPCVWSAASRPTANPYKNYGIRVRSAPISILLGIDRLA